MVNNWLKITQNFLYPPFCALCGDATRCATLPQIPTSLCLPCHDDLPRHHPRCTRCALPLSATDDSSLCGICQQHPPPYTRTYTAFSYGPPLSPLIQALKFERRLDYGLLLSQLMIASLSRDCATLPDVLIPVPLHRTRLAQRGFNQALELARPLARHFNIALDSNSCQRLRSTKQQSQLAADERHQNMKGAFRISGTLRQRHAAIIDDVMSTGSTVDALAHALRCHGIEQVDVWICARADRHWR